MSHYLEEAQSILGQYELLEDDKKSIKRINRYTSIYLFLRAMRIFNTAFIEKKRYECMDIGGLEIQYSNKEKKFIIK